MDRLKDQHDLTDACGDDHCYIHHVDESSDGAYLICFECNHVYRRKRDLRRDWRVCYWQYSSKAFGLTGDRWYKRIWRVLTVRATKIHVCQHCTHDF